MSIYEVLTDRNELKATDLLFGGEYFASEGNGAQLKFKVYDEYGKDKGFVHLPRYWLVNNIKLLHDERNERGSIKDSEKETLFVEQLQAQANPMSSASARLAGSERMVHSDAPILITPSQALLMGISWNMQPDDLSKIYLLGCNHEAFAAFHKKIAPKLNKAGMQVSDELRLIANDESRRYFETHMAYQTLLRYLPDLDMSILTRLQEATVGMERTELKPETALEKDALTRGDDSNAYKHLPEARKNQCISLATLGFDAVQVANDATMPLDIYKTSEAFATDFRKKQDRFLAWTKELPDSNQVIDRNKIEVSQLDWSSKNLGLLRFDMPLPRGDIATSKAIEGYRRPTDNSLYDDTGEGLSGYPKELWDTLVHPYVNSPSGTMLCQLRLLHKAGLLNTLPEADLKCYLRCFISAMLYGSGGHSLHEFCYPLSLEEVRAVHGRTLNVETLFYNNNIDSLNQAIERTRTYFDNMVKIKRVVAKHVRTSKGKVQGTLAQRERDQAQAKKEEEDRLATQSTVPEKTYAFRFAKFKYKEKDKEAVDALLTLANDHQVSATNTQLGARAIWEGLQEHNPENKLTLTTTLKKSIAAALEVLH